METKDSLVLIPTHLYLRNVWPQNGFKFRKLLGILWTLDDIQQNFIVRAPLAAIFLSSNGMYIATASEQGTIIRVHLVSDATKVRIAHHPFTAFYTCTADFLLYLLSLPNIQFFKTDFLHSV